MFYKYGAYTIMLRLGVRQWDATGAVRVETALLPAQGSCSRCVVRMAGRTITDVWWSRRKVLTAHESTDIMTMPENITFTFIWLITWWI